MCATNALYTELNAALLKECGIFYNKGSVSHLFRLFNFLPS